MNNTYKLLYIGCIYAHQSFITILTKREIIRCGTLPVHLRISIDESLMNGYVSYYHMFTIDIHQFIKIKADFLCLYPLQLLSICQLACLQT